MTIFDRRVTFKPYEYNNLIKFMEAIQHSYWLVSEFDFTSDIQDFKVRLNDKERNLIKNALLAISQIEVGVKKFWSKIGDNLPKPEIDMVGTVFAESEVRHADAYSKLLEVLSLNQDFEQLLQNPAIQGRVDYLTKYLKNAGDNSREAFVLTLTLFSIFIEAISLFSQFFIIMSFNKHKNMLKSVDNVVLATSKEEQIHFLFGVEIIKIVRQEFPEIFNEDFNQKIIRAANKSYIAEEHIVDWMFEQGDLDFVDSRIVKEFIKDRFNQSLIAIGIEPLFEISDVDKKEFSWFDEVLFGNTHFDFFQKVPTNYTKFSKPITGDSIF